MKIKNQDGSEVSIEQLEQLVPPMRRFVVTHGNARDGILTREVLAHKESSTSFGMIIFTRVDIDRLNVCLHERTVWASNNVAEYEEDCDYVDPAQSKLTVSPSLRNRFKFN